jgi:hypothetical protein
MLVTEGSGGSGLSLRYEDLDSVGPRTTFGNWLWTIEATPVTFEGQWLAGDTHSLVSAYSVIFPIPLTG